MWAKSLFWLWCIYQLLKQYHCWSTLPVWNVFQIKQSEMGRFPFLIEIYWTNWGSSHNSGIRSHTDVFHIKIIRSGQNTYSDFNIVMCLTEPIEVIVTIVVYAPIRTFSTWKTIRSGQNTYSDFNIVMCLHSLVYRLQIVNNRLYPNFTLDPFRSIALMQCKIWSAEREKRNKHPFKYISF